MNCDSWASLPWSGATALQRIGLAAGVLGAMLTLAACKPREDIQNKPLTAWLNDRDACVRQTVQSIIASGRPWPNELLDSNGELTRIDLWVANQLYVLPAGKGFPFGFGGDPPKSPHRYYFFGNVEDVLGVPPAQRLHFKHPGVGPTLYGSIRCYNHEPKDKWVENRWPNAPTRTALMEQLARRGSAEAHVQERQDIRMTEVRWRDPANTNKLLGAVYVPLDRDIAQTIDGVRVLKTIVCSARHSAESPLSTADICQTWVYLGPGLWLEFSVYQQAMTLLPDLHNHILNYFESNRQQ